jgi:hypothetical protein
MFTARNFEMPNGGMLPSCFTCKWTEKSKDFGEAIQHCYCTLHSLRIIGSPFVFCPDLSTHNDAMQPGKFIVQEGITGDNLYIWLETSFETNEPAYIYGTLVPITTYSKWSDEQKVAAMRAKQQEKKS